MKKDERKGLPSASAIELYATCPGAFLLQQQVPESERFRNRDSDAGDRIHEAREKGDATHLTLSEADVVRTMAETEERIFFQWKDEFQITDAEIFQERRLWLTANGTPVASAKMDFYAVSQQRRMALLLDRKSGRKAVTPAPSNWQLRTGAVILFTNFNLVHVRAGIVAPWQKTQPLCDYGAADLITAWGKLSEITVSTRSPALARRRAGTHCDYCAAAHICPEAGELISAVTQLAGMRWSAITPEQKLEWWDRNKTAKKLIEQFEKNIDADLRANPEAVPGLVKKPDTTVREAKDLPGWYAALCDRFPDVDRQKVLTDFNNLCSLSLGVLTDLYRSYSGGTKEEADAWINAQKPLLQHNPKKGPVVRKN